MTEAALQLLCVGLIGFVLGIFSGMLMISFLLRRIIKEPCEHRERHRNDYDYDDDDNADWWKHGGNPPGVYDAE